MENTSLGRREFVLAASSAVLGSAAGCAQPPVGSQSDSPPDTANRASESSYTDVYRATIDSVTLVRVYGIEDPFTGEEGRGQGSAFVYDERHVVTNHHVVADGRDVELQYTSGDWTGTSVVGTDIYSDLAVLEVDERPEGAEPLALADERPVVGQEALAIGNPFGLDGSMSKGIVSGVDRSLPGPTEFSIPNAVQTDAAVNPGNSGGPLVNLGGEVIGVVTAGGGDNVGFAISAALAERVVPALVADGEYDHSYMGVRLLPVDPVVAGANDLPEATGVLVAEVVPGGPSDGVLRGSDDTVERRDEPIPVGGDVIVGFDGVPTPDMHALSSYLALETDPGDVLEVAVRRDGTRETVELTLGERPEPS
jgi:S1-C subfamily serine protease